MSQANPEPSYSAGTLIETASRDCVYQLLGARDERGWYDAVVIELSARAREKGWTTGEEVWICPFDIGTGSHQLHVLERL